MMRLSPIRCSRKRTTHFLGNLREERPNIGIEYEVHFLAADGDDERIQRIMLAAARSKPVRNDALIADPMLQEADDPFSGKPS
jgi:hypothetical protein